MSGWFGPPLILPEYLPALGQLMVGISAFESVRDLTEYQHEGQHLHGFRTPEDLTTVGREVFAHSGFGEDQLEAGLFRFRVTDKARLWCLADRDSGEFTVMFWDPHHYLGTGHRYNDLPAGPEWDQGPFDDVLTSLILDV